MASNVYIVNTSNVSSATNNNSAPKLHSGSIVKGRVISQIGVNSYVLSVAGNKISVQSHIQLKPGTLFTGQIGVKNNTITIKLLGENNKETALTLINSSRFNPQNSALAGMLESFGLPVVPESLSLLQFALSMGIKPEAGKLIKSFVRGNEKNNKNPEKAQTALLIEEKGLNATDYAVEAVTNSFSGKNDNNEKQKPQESFKSIDSLQEENPDEQKKNLQSYFEEVDAAAKLDKAGPLTLFNMVKGIRQNNAHWIVLPFEWTYNNSDGVIRVLFDEDKKSVRKAVINCNESTKKIACVIYFHKQKVESVRFGITGFNEQKLNSCVKLMGSLFPESEIEAVDYEVLKGFAADDIDIPVFRGEV